MDLQAHPAAELFPLLSGAEYESFKADIAERGLIEPIWLCEGKILDGRNRYRACGELGLEPKFRDYDGESPVAFAWSLNGKRRHLKSGQLAVIAHKMLPALREEASKRLLTNVGGTHSGVPILNSTEAPTGKTSNEVAAELVGIGASMVQQINYVAKEAPDLVPQIESGEVTVNAAYHKVKNGKAIPTHRNKPKSQRAEEIRPLAQQGYLSSQIAAEIGISAEHVRKIAREFGIRLADKQLGHVRKIDARRVIETTVFGLEGNKIVFDTIRGGDWDITAEEAKDWHASLGKSIKELNWLRNQLGVIASGN